MNPTDWENPYLNFLRLKQKRKSKVRDLYVNESQDRGALKPVYFISSEWLNEWINEWMNEWMNEALFNLGFDEVG